jgi:hypothetical protein
MFIFPNKSLLKNDSLQKYIDDSTEKSIQDKIKNKKNTLFIKSPVKCDLHYLNYDCDWSKKELNKNYMVSKYNLHHFLALDMRKGVKNDIRVPFYFYFISTTSFFVWNYLFQENLWKK